jgi:ABC-type molybdate transport system substrate-binding protein
VGPFPDSLGLHLDVSGAVLNIAAAPKEAEAFLAYITAPKAREAWKSGGIVEAP